MDKLYDSFLKAPWYSKAEHLFTVAIIAAGTVYVFKKGPRAMVDEVIGVTLNVVPGAEGLLDAKLEAEVAKTIKNIFRKEPSGDDVDKDIFRVVREIPEDGKSPSELLALISTLKSQGLDPHTGKMWAYTYITEEEHHKLLTDVYAMFSHTNALNPSAFPCLRKFENEVVSMAGHMLGGDRNVVGAMTTGGTESILMAMKAMRELAFKRGITHPEVVMPHTAHVAFEKAAHYFKFKTIRTITKGDMRADVKAMERAITRNTICLVVSAPQYPHGVIDPVEEVAALAQERGICCHVDSCVGGFFLPWIKELGYDIPPFDFSVPGVTSMSADIHKYGFALKGTSVVLFKNAEIREGMFFVYNGWCGGIYASPSMTGSRPGGIIASAWVGLQAMGKSGYTSIARQLMETSSWLQDEINAIEGLQVISDPNMCIFAFHSTDPSVHIFSVADCLENKFNYQMERQPNPDCIHLSVTPPHKETKEKFIEDLKAAFIDVKENPENYGGADSSVAMYGMVASVPSTDVLDKFVKKFLSAIFRITEDEEEES